MTPAQITILWEEATRGAEQRSQAQATLQDVESWTGVKVERRRSKVPRA